MDRSRIPDELRERYGIDDDSLLVIEAGAEGILLRPEGLVRAGDLHTGTDRRVPPQQRCRRGGLPGRGRGGQEAGSRSGHDPARSPDVLIIGCGRSRLPRRKCHLFRSLSRDDRPSLAVDVARYHTAKLCLRHKRSPTQPARGPGRGTRVPTPSNHPCPNIRVGSQSTATRTRPSGQGCSDFPGRCCRKCELPLDRRQAAFRRLLWTAVRRGAHCPSS